MEIGIFVSVCAVCISLITLIFNRFDKAKQTTKENHQELIEYQLKELKEDYKSIATDIKDIKKMLDNYRETFRSLVKTEMEEHIKVYHSKEKK